MFKTQKISFIFLLFFFSYPFLSKTEGNNTICSIQSYTFVNQDLSENADFGFRTDQPQRNLDLIKNTEQEISLEIKTFKLKSLLNRKRTNAKHNKSFNLPSSFILTQIGSYHVVPDYISFRCLVI